MLCKSLALFQGQMTVPAQETYRAAQDTQSLPHGLCCYPGLHPLNCGGCSSNGAGRQDNWAIGGMETETRQTDRENFMMAISASHCCSSISQESKHYRMYIHTTSRFTWQLTPPLASISFHSPPGPAFRQPISSRLTRDKAWWSGSVSPTSLAHARCWLVLHDRLLTQGRCCRESSSVVETNLKAPGVQC